MANQVRPWLVKPSTSGAPRVRKTDWEPASQSHQGQRHAPQQKSECTGASCPASHQELKAWQGWGRPCTEVEANPSAGGQERNFSDLKSAPQSSRSRDSQESRAPDSKALARHSPTCAAPDIAVAASWMPASDFGERRQALWSQSAQAMCTLCRIGPCQDGCVAIPA